MGLFSRVGLVSYLDLIKRVFHTLKTDRPYKSFGPLNLQTIHNPLEIIIHSSPYIFYNISCLVFFGTLPTPAI